MDFFFIIKDILFGIFGTILGIVASACNGAIASGLNPDWSSALFRTAVFVAVLGSPFCAASIAEARGRSRLLHFVLGLFAPWIYPILIFFTLPRYSQMSGESESEDAADGKEEGAGASSSQDALPESHYRDTEPEPQSAKETAHSVSKSAGGIGQGYFARISADESGHSLGPYNLTLSDGRTIEISAILNALPDVAVVEISEGDGKKRTVRFPYSKIRSCIPIGGQIWAHQDGRILGKDEMTQSFSMSTQQVTTPFRGELLNPGTIVGNCRIESVLGCGGMGIVYLAKHNVLDVQVAIKIFSGNIFQIRTGADLSAERFVREAKLAVRLRHPNAVGVMDAGVDKSRNLYYMVMEYVDGGTIGQMINKHGPLSEENALNIMLSVAGALDAAHKCGIVHRDIKPDNIMLSSDGVVKLADLGLGKEISHGVEKNITADDTALGSPAYISPEQAKDFKNADIRSDIYSLGATLYHILTAEPPFIGDTVVNVVLKVLNDPVPNPRTVSASISEEMAMLCMKMMDKNPSMRFQTPQELIVELEAIRARRAGA